METIKKSHLVEMIKDVVRECIQERKEKWIQSAVNPAHKGDCTPMTKSTCTPARKALAKRFKSGDIHQDNVDEMSVPKDYDSENQSMRQMEEDSSKIDASKKNPKMLRVSAMVDKDKPCDHSGGFAFDGKTPNTGNKRCNMCGATKNESVSETDKSSGKPEVKSETKSVKSIKTSIENCARCGKEHKNLTFKPFTNKNMKYGYWAACPSNGEPILMKMMDDKKTK